MAAALVMMTVVAGCVFSTREKPRIAWVVADEQRIEVTSEIFTSTRSIGVKYTDSWQTEEYALFEAGGMQLEIIYAEASKAFTVALDYQMPLVSMVPTWNLNSRQNLIWGPLGRIDSRLGTWFYRTYELSDIQRSCAGFMVEWDEIYEDPLGRPRKVLFGYFCAAEGMALENKQIRTLIPGIGIRPQGELSDDQTAHSDINAGSHNPAAI